MPYSSIAAMGSTTFPTDLDIFRWSIVQCECVRSFWGIGRSSAESIAGK